MDVSRARFIPPALAALRASPPAGERWQYELKFDGYRALLHKAGGAATMFGKNGGDLTRRFPSIVTAVLALPVRSCIIDGELIAAGAQGQPDFLALLHGRHVPRGRLSPPILCQLNWRTQLRVLGRVGRDVTTPTPLRPGCADFPLPVLHGRALLTAV